VLALAAVGGRKNSEYKSASVFFAASVVVAVPYLTVLSPGIESILASAQHNLPFHSQQ
jgi:hypothetical protein